MNRDDTLDELRRLVAEVLPGCQLEVFSFDAGGFRLDVDWRGRWFEMAWRTGRGFGVSESAEDTLPFAGHDFACATITDVRSRLLALRDAPLNVRPEPAAVS